MTATASWGVSQLLGNESLPEVPSDVLPEWLRNMVDGLAEQHQVAPALPAMVALSILGAACGGRVFISPKRNWVEPTNVYTAVALPPGEGKTPPFTALAAPVYEVERALQAEQAILHLRSVRTRLELTGTSSRSSRCGAASFGSRTS